MWGIFCARDCGCLWEPIHLSAAMRSNFPASMIVGEYKRLIKLFLLRGPRFTVVPSQRDLIRLMHGFSNTNELWRILYCLLRSVSISGFQSINKTSSISEEPKYKTENATMSLNGESPSDWRASILPGHIFYFGGRKKDKRWWLECRFSLWTFNQLYSNFLLGTSYWSTFVLLHFCQILMSPSFSDAKPV